MGEAVGGQGGGREGVQWPLRAKQAANRMETVLLYFLLIVCFTSYFVFSIAVLPHSPGEVYYHLVLRRETRIPGVVPFSFRIGIWDLFVHRGQKFYTPTAFGKLWTTPGVKCMKQRWVPQNVSLYVSLVVVVVKNTASISIS